MYINNFGLEWPILRNRRISTFLPGTACIVLEVLTTVVMKSSVILLSVENQATFRRKISPPTSGSALLTTCFVLVFTWFIILPWRKRPTSVNFNGATGCHIPEDKVKVKVVLRPTVSLPVCLGVKPPSGPQDQISITVRQFFPAPLAKGQLCPLWLGDESVVHNCCYTPRHWIPFSPPPTTHRATRRKSQNIEVLRLCVI
jgi:hypothetical protein